MARKVILAVAGAGKTYHICHAINPNKRNLVLTYTNENVRNIISELKDMGHGEVPYLTDVMTFDSFVYRYAICPFNPSIRAAFSDCNDTSIGGLTWNDPPPQMLGKGKNGRPNPNYEVNSKWRHYTTRSGKYYGERMCELVMRVGKNREKLINRVVAHVKAFYDYVAFDEFQDFRCHKYDFMLGLARKLDDVILVGDYYQHSVSGRTNSGKPFDNVSYNVFVEKLENIGFQVDVSTLSASRRCSDQVCAVVRDALGIIIHGRTEAIGTVIRVTDRDEAERLFREKELPKLLWNKDSLLPMMENTISWGRSKGDTYKDACVVLTKSTNFIMQTHGKYSKDDTVKNKLYVALTRAKRNVYLVDNTIFCAIKDACKAEI